LLHSKQIPGTEISTNCEFIHKIKEKREKGKGFGEPFRDQCVCRETNQRNNHGLHSYGHAHTPFSLHHRASAVVDSFFFNLGLPILLLLPAELR